MGYLLKTKDGQYITRPISHPATDAQVRAQLLSLSQSGNLAVQSTQNAKITAHRGYHVTAKQNTIAAYKAAAEAGFQWIEVDIHTTADGVMVMGHNTTVTMYNAGTAVSVSFPSASYAAIKGYTWDAAGNYPLATLSQTLNAMKRYPMTIVLDLKTGSNEAVLREVSRCGMADHVYLSFTSVDGALSWADTMNKHKQVGIRVIPTDYEKLCTLAATVSNPIIADVNASMVASSDTWRQNFSNALSAGVPIMMSGCTLSNKAIWCVVSSGVMSNDDLNISFSDFLSAMSGDMEKHCTVTASAASASITVGSSASITASSDATESYGYVYAASYDPSIAKVSQSGFGSSATFSIIGVKAGNTTVRAFTGSGAYVNIAVTVS